MNETPPSAETITYVGEALKIASLLDDRVGHPDKGRILAWANQVEKYQFIRGDLLDGVQAFYDTPRERAMGVGDLIHHARLIRRERMEKEESALAAQREAESDAKAADEIQTITAAAIMGRVKETPRLKAARDALQNCEGRKECEPAIREYFAAKAEAAGKKPKGKAA